MIARLAVASLCLWAALAAAQEERPRKERSLTQQQELEQKQRLQRDRDAVPRPRDRPATKPAPAQSTQPVDRVVGRYCSAQPRCPSADGLRNVCRGVELSYSGRKEGSTDIISRCQAANMPDACGADLASGAAAHRTLYGGGCLAQCARVASCVDR